MFDKMSASFAECNHFTPRLGETVIVRGGERRGSERDRGEEQGTGSGTLKGKGCGGRGRSNPGGERRRERRGSAEKGLSKARNLIQGLGS